MELGVLGLDGFQSSGNAAASLTLDGETAKHKWGSAPRSGGFKLEGSGFCADDWRSSKVAKTDGDYSPASSASTAQLLLQSTRNLPLKPLSTAVSDANMLSFSSCAKSDTSALPYFQQMPPNNTGYYYSGALSNSTGMYLLNGVRGPFTPSQWLELEQQALIYKYMTANEPIPAQLLIPIRKAFESAGLFGGTLRPTPWGWGPFHLGYSNSTDPEPGRCRRTDGKKWRCSRDGMPDQKYCERHMNRGRHRSRKHVEGQAKSTATTTTTNHTPPPSSVAPGPGLSNSFDMTHHPKSSHHSPSMSMNPLLNSCQGFQDSSQLSFLSLSGESAYSIPKHQDSNQEFTLTTSQKNSGFCWGNDGSTHGHNNSTDGSSLLWPGLQSPLDTTQLSVSHQQLEMGLGVGAQPHNSTKQTSWIPSSWEPSMGGPLGEALQSGNGDGKKTSAAALNLLPKGWDGMGNYQVCSSSPTGVLQKSVLLSSLSNSSAGSSPRGADNSKNIESGGSLCNDLH